MLWLMLLPPPRWPTSNFDAPYGVFFRDLSESRKGESGGEGGEEEGGVEGAGTFQAVSTKVTIVSKVV